MAVKGTVIRQGVQVLGSLGSGTGDPILTRDGTTKEVGTVPAIDTSTFVSTALLSSYLLVGNVSNIATPRQITGSVVFSATGVTSISPNVITNTEIFSGANIAYSKLNLSASITNTDIAAAAQITRTKIANGSANRILINDGSGVFSDATAITGSRLLISNASGIPVHSAVTATEASYLSGVSSAIQTQFSNKLSFSSGISPVEGDLVYYDGANWNRLPRGTSGQYLTATASTLAWVSTPNGLPTGGTANQYLTKIDGTDYNTQWSSLTLSQVTDVTASAAQVNVLATGFYDATSSIQTQLGQKLGTGLANNAMFVGNASNVAAQLSPGSNGQVLTISAGAPTWQTVVGTGSVTSIDVSGGTTGLTTTGGPVTTTGTITLTGTVNPTHGGTGFATYTTGDTLYASAPNVLSKLAAGTNGYVLTMVAGVPAWQAGGVSTFVGLSDGPGSFAGQALKSVRVNAGETALEYVALAGTGTVTTVSVVTANGVSGSVANATTTPAITLTLGAITPTSIGSATTVTTQSANDNSTKIASTAYVDAADALKSNLYLTHNTQTGNYVLVLTDKDSKLVEMNVGSANTVTVPPNASVAFPIGTQIPIAQYGAGLTSVVAGVGVTINASSGSLDSPGQYTPMVLEKRATNEWYLWNGAAGSGTVTSVSGTTNRITSTGGTTPVLDISASYVGQTSITTLGTLTSGATGAGFTIALGTSTVTGDLAFSNLQQIAGLSVLGVTGTSTADVAAITAGTDNTILSRSGSSIGFNALTAAMVPDSVAWKLGGNTLSGASVIGSSSAQNITLQTGAANLLFRSNSTDRITIESGGNVKVTGAFGLNAIITPTAISGSTNDYNPTGLDTATVLRISSTSANSITGISGGYDGRIIQLFNVGSFAITFANESASSTAANRFALSSNISIFANHSLTLQYDATTQRWRATNNSYLGQGFWNTTGDNTGGGGAFSFGSGEGSRIIFKTNTQSRGRLSTLITGWYFGADTEPISTVDIGGSLGYNIQTLTANTTLGLTHNTILADAAGGTFTVTLPTAASAVRRAYTIKLISATNTVIIDGDGSETIDGATTKTLSTQYEVIKIQSNGTAWFIISQ